jgi:nitroreductase
VPRAAAIMQRWRFVVIRDPNVKETVGALYKRAWDEQVAPRYRSGEPAPGMSRERFLRLLDAAEYLAAHIHEAPVWIVPCLEGGTPTRTSGSSIYPAVQNMLLAARAQGLGATLTTLYLQFEKVAEAALGSPRSVNSYALLPIGYPMGRFGPVRRVPLTDVVFEDQCPSQHARRKRFAPASASVLLDFENMVNYARYRSKGEPNRRDNRWISIRHRSTPISVRATGLQPVFHAQADQHPKRQTR